MVWLAVLVGFVTSILVAMIMVYAGQRLGIVDRPDGELKTHTGTPVPLGGVALFLALQVGLVVAGEFDPALLVASGIILTMGLIDDIRGLSPVTRLIGAFVAGLTLVVISDAGIGVWGSLAVVMLVVVGINAVNLFDGLDGLASSVTALSFVALGVLGVMAGVGDPWLPLVMTAGLVGVLTLNWPPARLYLGDNGAYVIGVTFAWAVIHLTVDWGTAFVAASLIGVPLIDLVVTVARRYRGASELFAGDRDHTYDLMLRRTHSVHAVLARMIGAQVAWLGLVLVAYGLGGSAIAIPVAVVGGIAGLGVGLVRT